MTIEEMNSRLKTTKVTDENKFNCLHDAYIIFDLEKDEFCKVVDTIGVEPLIARVGWYRKLLVAERELTRKEIYLEAKVRLAYIDREKDDLNKVIRHFESTLEV